MSDWMGDWDGTGVRPISEVLTRDTKDHEAMVSWTCYECFGKVLDHDNDGIGWCQNCRRLVDSNGVVQPRFAALRGLALPPAGYPMPTMPRSEFVPRAVELARQELQDSLYEYIASNTMGRRRLP